LQKMQKDSPQVFAVIRNPEWAAQIGEELHNKKPL